MLERASSTHNHSVQLARFDILTFTCSVSVPLPQVHCNKLRLTALETPCLSPLVPAVQRKGMVIIVERTPKVSIVIPVYNTEKYLCQCLDSVINQTLTDFEIICVDDGSTDESPSILSNYEKRDSRFKVISQSNKGPGTARNIGMNQASGEYLIFLDSDDWFELDFLSKLVETCEIHQSDISICRSVEFDTETGKESPSNWMLKTELLPSKKTVFSPEEAATVLFQFTYGMAWDKLYRRSFLMNEGISFPNLKNSEDLAFVFPTLLAAKRIAVIEKVLVHHRINRSSSVSNTRSSHPMTHFRS